jgi:hypothetical protein
VFFREKGYRVEDSLAVKLRKDPGRNIVGSVRSDHNVTVVAKALEHRCGGDGHLERCKSSLFLGAPLKDNPLTRQASKRPDYLGLSTDKATVEISEPQERADILNLPRYVSVVYGHDLLRIYPNALRTDN